MKSDTPEEGYNLSLLQINEIEIFTKVTNNSYTLILSEIGDIPVNDDVEDLV